MKQKEKKKTDLYPQVEVLHTDPERGLSAAEVALRRESGLHNTPSRDALPTTSQILAQHCLTFFNFVFLVLAAVLAVAGSGIKNMTFLIVVVINTVIGCVQELRARNAVKKLTLLAQKPARAVRDGKTVQIPSRELVRDDIVIFGPGDQICADALVCSGELRVNEALVTGEADAVIRLPGDTLRSGSFVVAGNARARLTQVGDAAFAARLTLEAKANPKAAKSEMMRALDKLIRVMGFVLIPVGVLLFCHEYFRLGLGLTASAEAVVAALVGMIPEGLYLLTSVAMAASAIKLSRRRVLVQDMNCIETLARVDVLCVDKTGTITEPDMRLEQLIPLHNTPVPKLEAILTAMYGSGEPENETAAALQRAYPGETAWHAEQRIPFTSQTKWSAWTFSDRGSFLVGAPEILLKDTHPQIRREAEDRQHRGSRVLLLAAYRGTPAETGLEPARTEPLALLCLRNPIRPQAAETFRYFREQGVAIKVISGDHPATAARIAREAGIENSDKWLDASTLQTPEDYLDAAENYTVFGRVTPDQKKKLILALKKRDHTVAMTGDGVNDVLALREADCSVAMAGGAQAASQVARLVLLDNDFSAMPGIVAEGRRVVNNIQRAAALFLVKNIFSLGLSLVSLVTNLPYPLIPIQLTVISALTIGVPSFFLALEPNFDRFHGNFLAGVLRRALPGGLTNILAVLAIQLCAIRLGLSDAQTGTVCAAVLGVVGLLVLFVVSKPLEKFRAVVWIAMAVALVGSFTLVGGFFELDTALWLAQPLTLLPLLLTPLLFAAVSALSGLWKGKNHADL